MKRVTSRHRFRYSGAVDGRLKKTQLVILEIKDTLLCTADFSAVRTLLLTLTLETPYITQIVKMSGEKKNQQSHTLKHSHVKVYLCLCLTQPPFICYQ